MKKTTSPKPVDPLNGLVVLQGGHAYPLLRAVHIESRVILVVIAHGLEAAFEMLEQSRVKFVGYVGLNGPSRHKLKDAKPLDAEAIGAKLFGHVLESI